MQNNRNPHELIRKQTIKVRAWDNFCGTVFITMDLLLAIKIHPVTRNEMNKYVCLQQKRALLNLLFFQ